MAAKSPKPKATQVSTNAGRACSAFAAVGLVLFFFVRSEATALLSCLLFGLVLISRYAARRSATNLRLSLETPKTGLRAGERIPTRVVLKNKGRFLPIVHPCFELQIHGLAHHQSFHYAGTIPPGQTVAVTIYPQAERRGRQTLVSIGWRSLFPFALVETIVTCPLASEPFIVWPARAKLNAANLLRRVSDSSPRFAGDRKKRDHDASQLSSIREYIPGDSKRSINWRLSAKLDKLMVVESRPNQRRRITLQLDTLYALWPNSHTFESMLSLVSSLVEQLDSQEGLRAIYLNGTRFDFGKRNALREFLDTLSLCQPLQAPAELPDDAPQLRIQIVPARNNKIALRLTKQPSPAAT